MELNYLSEKEVVSFCFNNLNETAFILYKDNKKTQQKQPNNLFLVEEDFHYKIIKKQFKLLQKDECNITNQNYKKNLYDSYEGYSLYFWEAFEKLIVIYPFAYILIYDYNTKDLVYHSQCPGGKMFNIRNVIGSPNEDCLFISGENLNCIYCLNYSLFSKGGSNIFNNKINLPKDSKIYDFIVHPITKFLFVGFSNGLVKIYDYNNPKSIVELHISLNGSNNPENDKKAAANTTPAKEPDPVTCLDINTNGNYLLESTEKGNIYLWDAFQAIDKKKLLYLKESIGDTIFSCKFIKTRQFRNLQKFVCITKKGAVLIYFILSKDSEDNKEKGKKKEANLLIELIYKKELFEPLLQPNSIYKYNICLNSLLNISLNNNILSVSWPKFVELKEKKNKNDCTLVYTSLITKLYFFYSSEYPKINIPSSIQLKNRPYEMYIPIQGQPNFENKIYYADNYNIYIYDISTLSHRKLIEYSKKIDEKKVCLLKFDIKDMVTRVIFFLLIETEFHRNSLLIIDFDFQYDQEGPLKNLENINDFVILGNSYLNIDSDYAFFLGRDMANGFIYQISNKNLNPIEIGNNIVRAFHSPFNLGYCMIYKNIKNEYKFTQNFNPMIVSNNQNNQPIAYGGVDNYNNLFNLQCGDLYCFQLEENERIVDILFNITSDYCFCAVSMIDKINIYNREMKIVSTLKFDLKESPYLISSLIFFDCTLIFSKGNSISYFYPYDNINQLILRYNRKPIFISGILPDRFLFVSQKNQDIPKFEITSPMINPLEPLLIGYLDSPNINYDLLKQAVVTMFTNQVSQNLIDKLINRNLKEIAWMFMNDEKSSYQNINAKVDLLNEKLKFDEFMETLNLNVDLKSKLELDDFIWKLNYDSNLEYIKDILIRQCKLLIEYGQYNLALKILELLGDYPLALNLLLISTSPEDFDVLRIKFEAKESLNFTDNLTINHLFNFSKNEQNKNNTQNAQKIDMGNIFGETSGELPNMNEDKMEHYHKIFDNYEGEHFIFGANQNEFKINYIENIQQSLANKINNNKGIDSGFQRRILNFGETPFNLYSDDFNISVGQYQTLQICSLILQKIENYYGLGTTSSKEEREKVNKKITFFNYNLSLSRAGTLNNRKSLKDEDFDTESKTKKNVPFVKREDIEDYTLNETTDLDEITEDKYLSAYYHMDRGIGDTIEDVGMYQNHAKISCIYNNQTPNIKKSVQIKMDKKEEVKQAENDLKQIWSDALEGNEPLDYEDKWGRRSPPAHTIIFSKKLKTKIVIKNSKSLSHIPDKFTIELWIKLKDLNNVNIFSKEALAFDINQGLFKLSFHGQEIPGEEICKYNLSLDKFIHIAFLYNKALQNIIVLLNCEPVVQFNFILSGIDSNSPLIFGNEKFDGEMTEIRIWNERLPINFIKENYKTPLPILADFKSKLKMNIEVKEKKSKRLDSGFQFGEKEKAKKNIQKEKLFQSALVLEPKSLSSNIELNNDNNVFGEELPIEETPVEEYPDLELVNRCSTPMNNDNGFLPNNDDNDSNQLQFSKTTQFVFHENDFNFDK